jgi:hypothetical protein
MCVLRFYFCIFALNSSLMYNIRSIDAFFFGIPFHLQTVQVHLANCVMLQRRVEELSVALLHM